MGGRYFFLFYYALAFFYFTSFFVCLLLFVGFFCGKVEEWRYRKGGKGREQLYEGVKKWWNKE